jgi:hypothetical protein
VKPDFEYSVEEAETHAEELDHQHDDERCERRVERVQVVLNLIRKSLYDNQTINSLSF